jgi:uncharacterized protein (UPF0333 family)
MKGQSSLELLVTIGVILAFTVPVLFLLLSVSSTSYEETAKSQSDASARTIADAMNVVYSQGDGAQREVLINVPSTTQWISASNGEVVIRVRTAAGDFDAAAPTVAQITPMQPIEKKNGLLTLIVRNSNGKVELIDPSPR